MQVTDCPEISPLRYCLMAAGWLVGESVGEIQGLLTREVLSLMASCYEFPCWKMLHQEECRSAGLGGKHEVGQKEKQARVQRCECLATTHPGLQASRVPARCSTGSLDQVEEFAAKQAACRKLLLYTHILHSILELTAACANGYHQAA